MANFARPIVLLPTSAVTTLWLSKLPTEVLRELFVLGWRNLTPYAIGQLVMTVIIMAGAWGGCPPNA
jgi:hypothetical protein